MKNILLSLSLILGSVSVFAEQTAPKVIGHGSEHAAVSSVTSTPSPTPNPAPMKKKK